MTTLATDTGASPSRRADLRRAALATAPALAGALSTPPATRQRDGQPMFLDRSDRLASPRRRGRVWRAKLAVLSFVAAAVLVGPAVAPAQAITVKSHWYGWSVNLNKTENDVVASASITGAAAYLSAKVPQPAVKAAIAAGTVAIIGSARAARFWGKCLAFKIPRVGPPTVITWIQGC